MSSQARRGLSYQTPTAQEEDPTSSASSPPLAAARVATRLPAQDLDRARRFYAEKLGLEPSEERPGGLLYHCAQGSFALFASTGASPGAFTQMGFDVDDIEAAVAELRVRGVVFEEVDLPGLKTVEAIAEIDGNYPSKGTRERGCWFRDSEGTCWGSGRRWRSAVPDRMAASPRPVISRVSSAAGRERN
ncbi:MAG TPA: VOC family protein [Solirubrobacteraceae bacterium]|jgi:catechol 2,3-dioxygenase-like lactoylglutathione lyase family enzyme|nr:VOC family protein [Solirubrobacteraceae bacterium]